MNTLRSVRLGSGQGAGDGVCGSVGCCWYLSICFAIHPPSSSLPLWEGESVFGFGVGWLWFRGKDLELVRRCSGRPDRSGTWSLVAFVALVSCHSASRRNLTFP